MSSPTSASQVTRDNPSEVRENRSRSQWGIVELAAWLALTIGAFAVLPQIGTHDRWTTGTLGVLSWCLGTRVFLGHGGPMFTPQSVFGFAFSIFFGIGGVYHALLATSYTQQWIQLSLVIGLATQLAVFFGFWRRPANRPSWVSQATPLSDKAHGMVAAAGLAMFALGMLWKAQFPEHSHLLQGLAAGSAFSGTVLTTAAFVLHKRARLMSVQTVGVIALLGLYVRYVHPGTGRLHIAVLGLALASIYALRLRTMLVKVAVIVSTTPVLSWMAQERLAYIDTLANGSSVGRTGLESAFRPPQAFAELLHAYQTGGFAPSGGRNFLSVPAMFVPDWLWPDKPLALGYEISLITAPTKFGTGYSDASSILGEWLYDFGYLGLFLMVPIIGFAIPLLDRVMTLCLRITSNTTRLFAVAIAVMLCAGVPDLVWSGTHTYSARMLLRLPLILASLTLAVASILLISTDRPCGRQKCSPGIDTGPGATPRTINNIPTRSRSTAIPRDSRVMAQSRH